MKTCYLCPKFQCLFIFILPSVSVSILILFIRNQLNNSTLLLASKRRTIYYPHDGMARDFYIRNDKPMYQMVLKSNKN